jgi:CRP/FNR family transcriptional regulator, nitrogen oxide reductase regulator
VSSWPKHTPGPLDGVLGHHLPQAWRASDAPLRSDVASLIADQSRVRLLEGLSKPDQNTILAAASYRRFSCQSVVANQGEPADQLFLLIKGSARYFFITPEGRKVYLLWLVPGEIVGGASLLVKPSDFLVSTEIVRESCVLIWERKTIRSLATRYPRLLENGLTIATDYLTWYLASHLGLLCHTARQRLAHVLVSLAKGIGRKSPNGIQLDITNEQLANTANITLFTASRLLSEWQRRGAVAKSRGRVVLLCPKRLFLS